MGALLNKDFKNGQKHALYHFVGYSNQVVLSEEVEPILTLVIVVSQRAICYNTYHI